MDIVKRFVCSTSLGLNYSLTEWIHGTIIKLKHRYIIPFLIICIYKKIYQMEADEIQP